MGLSKRLSTWALVSSLVILGACDTETTPTPGNTVVGGAVELEGVPIPPQAEVIAPGASDDGVFSRTYEVRGDTPEDVLAFYTENLSADWAPVVGPGPVGVGSDVEAGSDRKQYLGGWTTGDRDLLITTGPRRQGDSQVVVLNLIIGPSGNDILDVDAVTP